jgi:hypothetical protein
MQLPVPPSFCTLCTLTSAGQVLAVCRGASVLQECLSYDLTQSATTTYVCGSSNRISQPCSVPLATTLSLPWKIRDPTSHSPLAWPLGPLQSRMWLSAVS